MTQAMRQGFSERDVADDLFGPAESNIFDRPIKVVADMIVFNWAKSFAGQQIRILVFRAQSPACGQVIFDLSQYGFGHWNQAVFSKFGSLDINAAFIGTVVISPEP